MNDSDSTTTKPQDPTSNTASFIPDPTGITGVTSDHNSQIGTPPDTPGISRSMSDSATKAANEISSLKDTDPDVFPLHTDMPDTDLDYNSTTSPAVDGEQAVSGSAPDPDAANDTLQNAQAVGLRLHEDEEHPQELNIASDIDAAEEYHKTH